MSEQPSRESLFPVPTGTYEAIRRAARPKHLTNSAYVRQLTAPEGVLSALIGRFETSPEFERLAPRTQDDYRKQFTLIYRNFGDLPLEALCDPRVRGVFKDWRDEIAKRSLRQADMRVRPPSRRCMDSTCPRSLVGT